MSTYVLERLVQYYETDQMQVVHHSNYIRWFEESRIFGMEAAGMSYFDVEKAGVIMPVLSAHAEYKNTVHFGDAVDIHMFIEEYNGVKLKIGYQIFDNVSQKLTTTGYTTHCFIDATTDKLLNIRRTHPEIHEIFLKMFKHSV